MISYHSLKWKYHHIDEIFSTGCTESCHFNNVWIRYFVWNCNSTYRNSTKKISCPHTGRCVLYKERWESKSPEPQEFIGVLVDSFTVPLHSPNSRPAVRAVQRDCHWGLKNGKNSHWSCEPIIQWGTRQSQYIFRLTNHKRIMPADWRPCLLPHWQS